MMKTNLRVAHVGKFAPGSANGVYAAVAGLVSHLPAEDIEVEVWHLSDSVSGISQRDEAGAHIVRLPRHKQNVRNAAYLPGGTWRHLQDSARSIDVIHLHSVYQGHNVALARLGIPYVVSPHSGYSERVSNGRNRIAKSAWRSLWEQKFVRRAASLHAVSAGEAQELEAQNLAQKIVCIPNGLDSNWLNYPSGAVPSDGPWLFLGRLAIDQKGLDLLLEGYAKALGKVELPHLLLVGPDFRGSVRAAGKDDLGAGSEQLCRSASTSVRRRETLTPTRCGSTPAPVTVGRNAVYGIRGDGSRPAGCRNPQHEPLRRGAAVRCRDCGDGIRGRGR